MSTKYNRDECVVEKEPEFNYEAKEERKRRERIDPLKLILIILMALMIIISVVSVIGYIFNWHTIIMLYSVGMGTFYALGGFIGLLVLLFDY